MRFSVNITDYSWQDGTADLRTHLASVARAADAAGLDTIWVPDHLLQADPTRTPDQEMLEAYTTLGFLAGITERVRVGAMVTGVTHRPPAVLVKAVTTLDVLSGGRAWLGIGAGYHNDEARAMGLPLPTTAERFGHLEETLELATAMWSGDTSTFEGRHYHLEYPVNAPQPVSRPRPPILIGGTGEKKTLRLVARYADACNLFDIPDGGQSIRHKLAVLAAHCERIGRPYAAIDKTVSTRLEPDESPSSFARRCAALAECGVEHVVVMTSGPWTEDAIASVGDTADTVNGGS